MGFTQARETQTGFEKMWDVVLRKYASPDRCTVYQPETWKINVTRRLEQLQRLEIKHLFIPAYSHGQAAASFTKEQKRIVRCSWIFLHQANNPTPPLNQYAKTINPNSFPDEL
jgi:hypothetical protein